MICSQKKLLETDFIPYMREVKVTYNLSLSPLGEASLPITTEYLDDGEYFVPDLIIDNEPHYFRDTKTIVVENWIVKNAILILIAVSMGTFIISSILQRRTIQRLFRTSNDSTNKIVKAIIRLKR